MQNTVNSLTNLRSEFSTISLLLVCLSLCCTSAHGAIAPWVKDDIGYHATVYPFLVKHPLVLNNIKEIKHVDLQEYHITYTYTTADDEKKTCTAKFGPTFMFRPYVKFYGSDCPVNEWEDDDDGFF